MVTLIFIRDILIAVLLSWIGVDLTDHQPSDDKKTPANQVRLLSGGCSVEVLTLESEPAPEADKSRISWFHS